MRRHTLLTALVLGTTSLAYSQANTKLSNLVSPTSVNQSLLPSSSNSKDLGSSSLSWRSFYLKGSWFKGSQRFLANSGIGNTFLGILSGTKNTTGMYNTAVGDSALLKNTSGLYNTAMGAFSLYKNSTGISNSAYGHLALDSNTTGSSNTAIGAYALLYNTTGGANTASGWGTLYHNTVGNYNTATGTNALASNSTGNYNTASGSDALTNNTIGTDNTAIGSEAMISNTTGIANTAVGYQALFYNTTASANTANGTYALHENTTGTNNTASGTYALYGNTTGYYNTASGYNSLGLTTTSYYNTALGYYAGHNYNNGWNNVFVGALSDVNGSGYYNVIALGEYAICTASNQVTIGNASTNSYRAYAGWSNISDGRYKENIKENVPGLSFITKLRPITYTLNATGLDAFLNKSRIKRNEQSPEGKAVMQKALQEKEAVVQTGFVAQDVERAAKEVHYNFSGVDAPKNSGDVYGLRYSEFVVPLVKAVQELDSANKAKDQKIAVLEERINKLEAGIINTNTLTLNSASLEQNTPNPVSSATTIRYHIPDNTTSAVINITTAEGKLIKVVQLTGASGQVNLNTTMLASGTYNYTLIVDGNQIDTKRLVIIK